MQTKASKWLAMSMALVFLLSSALNTAYTPVYAAQLRTQFVAPQADTQLFLPLISAPPAICGTVLAGGVALAGLTVELILDGDFPGKVLQTTQTASAGGYCFLAPPALLPTEYYYAKYTNGSTGNPDNNQYASVCFSDVLSTYTGTVNSTLTVIEVSDIPLTAPDDDVTKSLPADFQWQVRSASSSDTYQWNLTSATGGNPRFASAALGYLATYTVTTLPARFNPGVQYKWFVSVNYGGSSCNSYNSRRIKFNP